MKRVSEAWEAKLRSLLRRYIHEAHCEYGLTVSRTEENGDVHVVMRGFDRESDMNLSIAFLDNIAPNADCFFTEERI